MRLAAVAYLAVYVCAELLAAFVGPALAVPVHALVVVAGVHHWMLGSARGRQVAVAVAVLSTLRLLTLVLPIADLALPARVAIVGAPVMAGAVLALCAWGARLGDLGLPPRSWAVELTVASAGLPIGIAAYLALRPGPLAFGPGLRGAAAVGLTVLALVVLGGFLEELLFRGLLYQAVGGAFGPLGVVLPAVAFTATYAGAGSGPLVATVAAAGVVWGLARRRTGSIVGACLGHGVVNVMVFVVGPSLFPR